MEQNSPIIMATGQNEARLMPDTGISDTLQPNLADMKRNQRLALALNELNIGPRVRAELKQQGRSVVWLADQLCLQRTSLYYMFKQNSVNVVTLMRISAILGHNFLKDVNEIFEKYGL